MWMDRGLAGILRYAQDDRLEAMLRAEAVFGIAARRIRVGSALWVEREFAAGRAGRAKGSGICGWR